MAEATQGLVHRMLHSAGSTGFSMGFLRGPWLSSMYRVTVRYGPLARAPDLLTKSKLFNIHFTVLPSL